MAQGRHTLMDPPIEELLDKVDSIRGDLPADVRHIQVLKQSGADVPILQLRISSERDLSRSYDMLNRLLKDRIQRLYGQNRAAQIPTLQAHTPPRQ